MIKKEMKLLITFRTTTDAMAMETACKAAGADGRIIPVPGSISAGCGLGWSAKPESQVSLELIMDNIGITPQGIHQCMI